MWPLFSYDCKISFFSNQKRKRGMMVVVFTQIALFHDLIRANIFTFDVMLQLEMSIHCRCNGNKSIWADFASGLFQRFVQEKVFPNLRLSLITNILKAFHWYFGRKGSPKSHLQVFTYKRNIIHVWNWKQTAKLVLERTTQNLKRNSNSPTFEILKVLET